MTGEHADLTLDGWNHHVVDGVRVDPGFRSDDFESEGHFLVVGSE